MKDEIKEILEFDFQSQGERIEINEYERDILKDYITNLQEQLHQASLDIQELIEKDIGCPSWCDKLTNLQEKNERLNEVIHYWEDKYENTKFTDNVYKSRNEKAIEDINKMMAGMYSQNGEHLWESGCCNIRLKIIKNDLLNGDDEKC